jgi:hypothetical protein
VDTKATVQRDFFATKCGLRANVVFGAREIRFVIARCAIQRGRCRCRGCQAAHEDLYANTKSTGDQVDTKCSHRLFAGGLSKCQDAPLTHRHGADDHFDHRRHREPIQ